MRRCVHTKHKLHLCIYVYVYLSVLQAPVLYRRSGSSRVAAGGCWDYQISFIPTTLAALRSEVCSPALLMQVC